VFEITSHMQYVA